MRVAVLVAVAAAFMSYPAASYVVRHTEIPAPLQGTWAATDEDCRRPGKYIIISDKTYIDHDRSCSVLWVSETAAGHGPAYSAHMQCANSAAESQKTFDDLVMLAKDASHISMGPDFSKLRIVQKCATH